MKGRNVGRAMVGIGGIAALIGLSFPWMLLTRLKMYAPGYDLLVGKTAMVYAIISILVGWLYKGKPGKSYCIPIAVFAGTGVYYLTFVHEKIEAEIIAHLGTLHPYQVMSGWWITIFALTAVVIGGFIKIHDPNAGSIKSNNLP